MPNIYDYAHLMPMDTDRVAGIRRDTGVVELLPPHISRAVLRGGRTLDEIAEIPWDMDLMEATENSAPKPPPPPIKLLEEYRMDLTDLLMYLFKKQPRIIHSGHFSSEPRSGRMAERERAVAREAHNLYFKGDMIGYVECRGHKKLGLTPLSTSKKRVHYAQGLLYGLVHDLLPQVRIVDERSGQDGRAEQINVRTTWTTSVSLADIPF